MKPKENFTSFRCTSWTPCGRPSILSILRDLNPLLPSAQTKESVEAPIDYTDSLGHVLIDLELDEEEDKELLQLLQVIKHKLIKLIINLDINGVNCAFL